MRGLILAGGKGSRLGQLTAVTNKHLLPIGDQPMITRVLQTMLDAGITEIMIVTNPEHMNDFAMLTSRDEAPYNKFGCIYFVVQRSANGIADAINHGYHFFPRDDGIFVLLGDTLLTDGWQFRETIHQFEHNHQKVGAHIWTYHIVDPSDYGVLLMGPRGEILNVVEKPTGHVSNLAIPGIYLFDKEIWWQISQLEPSARGELEVTDLIRYYINHEKGCRLYPHKLVGQWADPGRSVNYYYKIATEMFTLRGEI